MSNSSSSIWCFQIKEPSLLERFKDPNFDKFEEHVKTILHGDEDSDEIYVDIVYDSNLKKNNSQDCRTVLEAFIRSKFFQNRAKQIKHLQLSGFWLDDWKPFLQNFLRHEAKMFHFKLCDCHLTPSGARTFAWLLENELGIQSLNIEQLTGDNAWILGLYNNTSITEINTRGINCIVLTLLILSKKSFRNENHNFNIDKFLQQKGKNKDDSRRHNDHRVDKKLPQHSQLLSFLLESEKQPKIGTTAIQSLMLKSSVPLFATTTAAATWKILKLQECHLTEQDANVLGWLLDTDASGVNVEYLFLIDLKGSAKAWASGLYKNKSIKTLELTGFRFWHSVVYFIQNGRANKLESVDLCDLSEEEDGKPHGVNNGETLELPTNNAKNNDTAIETNNVLTLRYEFDWRRQNRRHHPRLSNHLCKSIGNMLRRSTHLNSLVVSNVSRDLEYDFIKDAVWCQSIKLEKTDFEPHGLASLINGGTLKKLHLRECRRAGASAELLDQADLNLLDELCIGRFLSSEDMKALSHQFGQNKGPRKFVRDPDEFFGGVIRGFFGFGKEDLRKLAASLAGNTRIEEFELDTMLPLGPCELLIFLQSVSTMPSLNKLVLSGYRCVKINDSDDDEEEPTGTIQIDKKTTECEDLIVKLLLQRNIEFDFSLPFINECNFVVLSQTFQQCKLLLGCDTNNLPDTLWTHVFVHATKKSAWGIKDGNQNYFTSIAKESLLFYLVKQLPRLFQQACGDEEKKNEQRPNFIVPHHPNCPACRKRKFCA